MNYFKQLAGGTFALALLLGIGATQAQAADVVDTAAGVEDLSTLVALVQQAELVDALAEDPIRVRTPGDKVFVDRAEVIATDIETDNATVHLLNRVMVPWNLILRDVVQALRHN
jgi:uncharacterized surface protein with fasciclin (FAS1) repeats